MAADGLVDTVSMGWRSFENGKPIPMGMPAKGVSLFPGEVRFEGGQLGFANLPDDQMSRPFYVVGCVAYAAQSKVSLDEALNNPMRTTFCFYSDRGIAAIRDRTTIQNACGVNETAQ